MNPNKSLSPREIAPIHRGVSSHNTSMRQQVLELWRRLGWWLIYLGPHRQVTIPTTNGLLTVDSKDWLVGKYLYVRRSHEEHEMRSAVALLKEEGYLPKAQGGTLLNVGANIGMTCIGALRAGFFERAIAFEPAPQSYQLLVRNISQNGLQDRVAHLPVALSSVDSQMEMELSDDNSGDHRIRQVSRPGSFGEQKRRVLTVPARTLDHLLVEHPDLAKERVELVWVDVQGHEGRFLEGAQCFLKRGVPVVCEFWPYGIERSGMSPADFCRVLSGLFTHFYELVPEQPQRRSIDEFASLFDVYSGPREMCLVALVRGPR